MHSQHYPKRVGTSGGDHLGDLARWQHSFEGTSQRRRAVGDPASDLTGPEIEPQTFRTDSNILKTENRCFGYF